VSKETQLSWRGSIHCWSLDAGSEASLDGVIAGDEQLAYAAGALHLLQAVFHSGDSNMPRLWLVTRGAQSGAGGAQLMGGASLWGLGRVIALEHPELWGGLFDADPAGDERESEYMVREFIARGGEDQIAYRAGVRYVARLGRVAPKIVPQPVKFSDDASYLITGGLGSLGLQVAEWMIAQGARNVALIGRRPPSETAQLVIARMEKKGARVIVEQGDVADSTDCKRVLNAIKARLPALRGIVHAAGVLDDGVLYLQTAERFRSVMAPKVAGTWNLHVLTQDLPVEFFVLFSTAASVLGSPGQSNYAAANAYMDALAHYRRNLGLPAISINWGPWDEIGMAAELEKRSSRKWLPQGVTPIIPREGLEVLGAVMHGELVQAGVLKVNWTSFMEQFPADAWPAVLSAVAPGAIREEPRDKLKPREPELIGTLKNLPSAERRGALIQHVQTQVARVMGLEESELPDPEQGFFEMGLDSLMAVELKNYLSLSIGKNIPNTVMFQFSNISAFADYLLREVFPVEERVLSTAAVGGSIQTIPLEPADAASEDELLAQLASELAAVEQTEPGRGDRR
jgi:acyl carrier protein